MFSSAFNLGQKLGQSLVGSSAAGLSNDAANAPSAPTGNDLARWGNDAANRSANMQSLANETRRASNAMSNIAAGYANRQGSDTAAMLAPAKVSQWQSLQSQAAQMGNDAANRPMNNNNLAASYSNDAANQPIQNASQNPALAPAPGQKLFGDYRDYV